ncbi:MAG TPA: cation-transporting P-type ATPase [bacterium]|nr:cation-transporting P-type ATPase [bacterium]
MQPIQNQAAGNAEVSALPAEEVLRVLGAFRQGLSAVEEEYRAERAVEALRQLLPRRARVIRDGQAREIPAEELVRGDLLVLEEGGHVPADARLIEEAALAADHAVLTGESVPQRRIATAVRPALGGIDLPPNCVFMGTSITSGSGIAVVYATGMRTRFGAIAGLTMTIQDEPSPLQRQVARMARTVAASACAIGVALFAVGWATGVPLAANFLFALGVMVAMVPEGLPATLTLALAMGVQRMARRRALLKRLSSVETLGSTTVICTDKTGTLTLGAMTVQRAMAAESRWSITGVGYAPEGAWVAEDGTAAGRPPDLLLRCAVLCNRARLVPGPEREWHVQGDPTEGALLVAARKAGLTVDAAVAVEPRLRELPFDPVRKRMSTIHRLADGGIRAYVKGAPREILARCTRAFGPAGVVPFEDGARERIVAVNDEYARGALRVLGFAYRDLPRPVNHGRADDVERDMVFLGLMAMLDAPRPEVAQAVAAAQRAGIRILMVTGDYGLTAEAIARRLGIVRDEGVRIITGADLDGLTDTALLTSIDREDVIFARVSPAHKLRVVNALRHRGEVVAVTGDGVNDAPALRRADIGIAMGQTGTDVAKEAAAMILLDDSFATIVAAIEEGRAVFSNFRKVTIQVFSHNLGELLPIIFGVLFHTPLPLTALQVLSIDMGTDVLPSLALGAELPEAGVMDAPPRSQRESLLGPRVAGRILFRGAIVSATAIVGFVLSLLRGGWAWGHPLAADALLYREAITMTNAGIVVTQIANAYTNRTDLTSLFRIGPLHNAFLNVGEVVAVAIILAIAYWPPAQAFFNTAPVPGWGWGVVAAGAITLLVAEEIRKAFVRRGATVTRREVDL